LEEIDTDVTEEEVPKVLDALNQYKDLVARNIRQIGCTNKAEMRIKLEKATPVHYRPYQVSQMEREQLQRIINDLKEADVIEEQLTVRKPSNTCSEEECRYSYVYRLSRGK